MRFWSFFLFLKSVSKTDADGAIIDLKKSFFFISHIELKTDLSKLMEMNDLINGRSWTEERVQHSKYFPKWN